MRYSFPAIHATTQQQVAKNTNFEMDAQSLFERYCGSIVVSVGQ